MHQKLVKEILKLASALLAEIFPPRFTRKDQQGKQAEQK